jgi:hypothetical protein
MSENILEIALKFTGAGLSVIPIAVDGSKGPDTSALPTIWDEREKRNRHVWEPFRENIATNDQVRAWWANRIPRGIGVIGGKVSGNLVIVDFDCKMGQPSVWPEFRQACEDHDLLDIIKSGALVKTPAGGYHLYLRARAGDCPTTKVAYKLTPIPDPLPEGAEIRNKRYYHGPDEKGLPIVVKDGNQYAKWGCIETKAEGGYVVAPGSPGKCHPSGKQYKLVHGDICNIPIIEPDQMVSIFAMASLVNEWVDSDDEYERVAPQPSSGVDGIRPGDDYDERCGDDWLRYLEREGWKRVGNSPRQLWRRPGKTEGHSATTGYAGRRLFWSFTDDCHPFKDHKGYKPHQVYAILEHAGDFKAAAKALADMGYGSQRPAFMTNRASYQKQIRTEVRTQQGNTVALEMVTSAPPMDHTDELYGDLPEIEVKDRQLRHISDDAMSALVAGNDPEEVFVNLGALARLDKDDTGKSRPTMLGVDSLTGILARKANWIKDGIKDVPPPPVVVRDVLTLGDWPGIPLLKNVVTSPVLSPTFRMIDTPGFDRESGIYYDELGTPVQSSKPTVLGLEAAKKLIFEDMLGDFPFKDEASRSNAVALMLLPILRPAIAGPAPMTVIDAPTAGTGKSLLAEIILLLYSPGGVPARSCPPQDDDAEWKKSITSAMIAKSQFFYLDNVKGAIYNSSLLAAITSTSWTDRILGSKDQIDMNHSMIFVATANNISMDNELSRRMVWVRLDANQEHPEQRTGFRHENIKVWVLEHRAEILAALIMFVRAWLDAGRPPTSYKIPPLGSFEAYTLIMAGVMDYVAPGFLGNREAQILKTTETGPWHAFTEAWHEGYSTRRVGAGDLLSLAQKLLTDVIGDKGEASQVRRLGNALKKNTDRVFGGRKILGLGVGSSDVSSLRGVEMYRLGIENQ